MVWFGEVLPEQPMLGSIDSAKNCDVFLAVGTSALVYPAAALPYEALRAGAMVIEVNPEETPFSDAATFSLRGRAGKVLPLLVEALG